MKINTNFIYRQIDNVHFLIPIKRNNITNNIVKINEISAVIWKMIMAENEIKDIIKYIAEQYDEDIKDISEDVNCFVDDMVKVGLITK